MKNEVLGRLSRYLEEKQWTAKEFETKTGLGNGTAARISEATRDTTYNRISNSGIDLNIEWLRTGEGEMLRDVTEKDKNDIPRDAYGMVPLINIDSVGGMDSHNSLVSSEQYTERLIPFTGARDDDRAIYQSGESMCPAITPGSVLHIRQVVDWREYFGYGGVFVLWLRDGRRITKQVLKYRPDPSNFVTCHSFNPEYADEELPKKYIREVWKVITVLTDKGW